MLPEEYDLDDRTIGRVLAMAARQVGDKPLIIDVAGHAISYAESDRCANQIGRGVSNLGIAHQEPVLFMLPDGIPLLLLVFGLARRGAIQVPVNTAYRGAFLSRIINDSTSRNIVIDAEYLDRLAQVSAELTHLRRCIIHPHIPDKVPANIASRFELLDFDALSSDDYSPLDTGPSFHDLAGVMYTSGTTGVSKGVMVCHAHAYRYANNLGTRCSIDDRFYTAGLPLFHIAGQWAVVYRAMLRGATVILRRGYRNQYFWKDIREHGATMTQLLGAIANFLWQQPNGDNDADNPLERAGMFPVIPQWEAFAKRFGVELWTTYGSTECPPPCNHQAGVPFPNLQYVGDLKDTVDCKILDPNDKERAHGEVGEICVRPRNPWEISQGYWNQPEASVAAFRNLWFHSGDFGYVDAESRLYFVDRATDSMRRRGENISSMEVEGIVNQHSSVLESAAFPVWADESEQEVMITVTLIPGCSLEPESLIYFLNERMPYFMVPRYVDLVDEIIKTPTGKMRKNKLRERGLTATTWDRVAAGIKLTR